MNIPLTYNTQLTPLDMARIACDDAPIQMKLQCVLACALDLPNKADFFQLLGEQWHGFGHLRAHTESLQDSLRTAKEEELMAMMTLEERLLLEELPAEFVVYRGCYHANLNGISWSKHRSAAATYPYAKGFCIEAPPLLAAARVRRRQCVVKARPEGLEVIAWKPTVLSVELLAPVTH